MTQPQSEWVFPSAYGGAVKSPNPPQIHALMRDLRIEIGAVEAKKSQDRFGPKFPVRGAKDLAQKLANALNTLNMEAPVVAQEITLIDCDKIPGNERQSGNPVFRTLAHVKSTVRLIAPDTSFIDLVGSGHGGDPDDKSGGKASTYAWKDALLKGLSIPHEDMVDTDDNSGASDPEPTGPRATRAQGSKTGGADKAGGPARRSESPRGVVVNGRSVDVAPDEVLEGELGGGAAEAADEAGLSYVLTKIKAAESKADLEQIRAAIKSGVLMIEGEDRLSATKAFMARSKELAGG